MFFVYILACYGGLTLGLEIIGTITKSIKKKVKKHEIEEDTKIV